MDTTKFVYVVIDDLKVANIINNKESLIAILCETDNPDIRTFYTLEGAEQFKKQYDDKAQNKSQQKVNTGIKKYRESQESPPKKSASTSTSHQATPKVNLSQTDEEMAKSVEIGKVQGPQLINKEDIYYYYREKDEDMAAARAKINPSDCYILSFHGVARPGETGAASFEILTLNEDRIYFDKISGLNKATSNEAQYCGLIYGLMSAMSLGIKQLNVQGNSQLVIEQMTGGFKVSDTMKLFNKEAKSLVSNFSIVSFTQKKKC